MSDVELAEAARQECLAAFEQRFGWLLRELTKAHGSLQSLPAHQQRLWYGREKVIRQMQAASEIRDPARRIRAYRKITKACRSSS